jgi:hypothetical protein
MDLMVWGLNTSRDNVQTGYDADHSPPSSAEVNNVGSHYLLSINVFMAWMGTASSLWTVALN